MRTHTSQIMYELSWIFLFLPMKISEETGNDGAEYVVRHMLDESEPFYCGIKREMSC